VIFFTKRRNLSESLEQYAARHGTTAERARPAWRFESIRILLGHADPAAIDPRRDLCQICPGVSVPTPPAVGW
jgi:hypothetical protein